MVTPSGKSSVKPGILLLSVAISTHGDTMPVRLIYKLDICIGYVHKDMIILFHSCTSWSL